MDNNQNNQQKRQQGNDLPVRAVTFLARQVTMKVKLYVLAACGVIIFLIFVFITVLSSTGNGDKETSQTGSPAQSPSPNTDSPLQITKGVNKTAVSVGDEIEYTLKVAANSIAGDKVTVTEKVPAGTSFVSASSNSQISGDTVTWKLSGSQETKANRVYPSQTDPSPSIIREPVQQVTTTPDEIRAELNRFEHARKYAVLADFIVEKGKEYNVEPAFFMGIWRGESAYFANGWGIPNNPTGITYFDGIDKIYKGAIGEDCTKWNVCFAKFDTLEHGIEAFYTLIKREYYPKGQTDTWTIHSGIGPTHQHAYHGVNHIGPDFPVANWNAYVDFYTDVWVGTMNSILGTDIYTVNQEIKLTIKANQDNVWIANTALGFAPGAGNVTSDQAVVRVGNAPQATQPGSVPSPSSDKTGLLNDIKNNFGIQISSDFDVTKIKWMWEALWTAKNNAPAFLSRLHARSETSTVIIREGTSTRTLNGQNPVNVEIGPGVLADTVGTLFKQVFIHELGHVIHGISGGSYAAGGYNLDSIINSSEGNLTTYARGCWRGSVDEDFAETVSYYVFNTISEQNTGVDCPAQSHSKPLDTHLQHLQFIKKFFQLGGEPG